MGYKPFVKIFKSIHGFYMYDANKNEILPVSEESYRYLELLEKEGRQIEETMPKELEDLKEQGYLAPPHVKRIKHPMTDYVEVMLTRRMKKITLQLTQNCNFRCKYCHYTDNSGGQRLHSQKRMDIETAKAAILFLKDHSIDMDEVYVGLYGGEPLLEFPMIKEIVAFTRKALEGKKIQFMLTTNAALMNEEIIQYIEQEQINLLVSLDGPKEINDLNRVKADGSGTFDTVIEKVKYIHEHHPKLFKKMMLNVVMNPSHDYDKILSLFRDYPFLSKIEVTPTIVDDTGAKEKNVFAEQFVSKIRYYDFLTYLSVLNRYPKKDLPVIQRQRWSKLKEDIDDFHGGALLPEEFAPGGPCVPGEDRLLVTVEGNFIACERVNEISDCMIIGSLKDGLYFDKIKDLLNVAKITEEQCKGCWAFMGCTICGKKADENGKLSAEVKLEHCGSTRSDFMDRLRERVMLIEAASIYDQASIV